jgi:hypothetical protein
MELPELDRIPWYEFEHAYGSAFDVPKELRRLTSTDSAVQRGAMERLYGTIYHQGSLYPATVPAVLPLLRILANPAIERRTEIARLFRAITESAAISQTEILSKWAQLSGLPHATSQNPEEPARREFAERRSVREEIARWSGAVLPAAAG